ncbi:MAG: 6,7-dimethyl-8-ribityllumazine synthase [Bacteroidetes bacterium]|nr:6,7-dimethyl-8-ribityllumazine synthase [Rhodothermia bacterium]MCS7155771.1 6,7-dimethyl-8-ribityllumazine synthase [Bacteroidota bacterium]MCX7906128.1 6,7-dimethyl-8-ribityllumazine synthase [Bacteroidota bacterium]MDW8138256.1 6,7-dimethyl-8-ribityllumazine synthase [Bacteroidota bacterium]MDW8285940.1 6,7-dimethyl-8-ribityllumazine synthase [Bacteroidota bacterium]
MSVVHEGTLSAQGLRLGIAVSRWNALITHRLLEGALEALRQHGADPAQVEVAWCPGAFELPLLARRMADTGRFEAIIALGAVIRGETPHFEYVASAAAQGLSRVMLETNIPVAFGVLTTDTLEQALERAGGKAGNKGAEAALAAVEMAHLLRRL